MAKNFHQVSRMCISCRGRDSQEKLLRLKCVEGDLEKFDGVGRTFYLCDSCLDDEKKLSRSLMRHCKSGQKDKLLNKLKEIIADDR